MAAVSMAEKPLLSRNRHACLGNSCDMKMLIEKKATQMCKGHLNIKIYKLKALALQPQDLIDLYAHQLPYGAFLIQK
jgi:hypothetical protein